MSDQQHFEEPIHVNNISLKIIFVQPASTADKTIDPLNEIDLISHPGIVVIAAGVTAGVGVLTLVWTIGKYIYEENKEADKEAQEAAKPPQPTCVFHVHCHCDTSNISVRPELPEPRSEPESQEPEQVIEIEMDPKITIKPESESPIATPIDDDDTLKILPEESTLPMSENKLTKIISDMGKMSFSNSESAEAYFQEQLSDAGIQIKSTTTGLEVLKKVDGLVDPARVSDQLQSRGINDKDLIKQVVAESNTALIHIESFIQTIQSEISIDTTQDIEGQQKQLEELVVDYNARLASIFSSKQHAVATPEISPIGVETEEESKSTGLIVKTAVVATSGTLHTGNNSGFYPATFISVFDEDAWLLEA